MLVSYSYYGEDISHQLPSHMYIIAWKGAAPTGTRKRAGSTAEELPSKRSKQGTIISLLVL
jgi:hypothetical protein